MYIEGELYEPNKISNKQLLVYGDGWLTDIGKLALQHAHKAVPIVGKVFKFFYDRRKRKQAEAEKNKMREHLMKMSSDIRLKPEDRMKILDLLREIKIEPHKYTNEQFHKLFDNIQKGVNLASMAGLVGIHKYEQSKEHKNEPEEKEEFHDAKSEHTEGGKMYLNPNKRRQQRQGKIPPKGNGFDEIVKLLKKNPEVAHKADKFKKKGLTITEADIEYIMNLFKKHGIFNKNKKQLYTIKNDFFSLTKPSNRHYEVLKDKKGNILNPNIYTRRQGTYNASINGIHSVSDDRQMLNHELLDRLYESTDKLAKNMENLKDLKPENKVVPYDGIIDDKPNKTSSEGELLIKNRKYRRNPNIERMATQIDKSVNPGKYEVFSYVSANRDNLFKVMDYLNSSENKSPNKYIGRLTKTQSKYIIDNIIKEGPLIEEVKNGIELKDKEESTSDSDEIGDPNGHDSEGLRKHKGGKMYLRPSNRIKQRHGTIPPKGQGIGQHHKATTLPFHFSDNKVHVHKHLPSMFSENNKGSGMFGGFLEAY